MSKKIKSLVISISAIILIVLAYFFLPTNLIKTNISAIKQKIFDEELLAGITVSGYVEGESSMVREHRGYSVMSTASDTSYDGAAGKTGIKGETELNQIIADMNNVNSSYPWWETLAYNTSIFCHERGQPLPSKGSAYLYTFHTTNSDGKRRFNIDGASKGSVVMDIVEASAGKGCEDSSIEVIVKLAGAQEETETILESDLDFATTRYTQKTRSNVNYDTKTGINLNVADAYILSYSERKMYRQDRAQVALWLNAGATEDDINSADEVLEEEKKLYHIAKAVEELSSPIKPTMSEGTNTGTIIEGTNYKVGPITMNDYTLGWSDAAETYTGKLIAGITGAEVTLDNGEIVYLDSKDYFSFTPTASDRGSKCTKTNDASEVCNAELWRSPTAADGYFYPTPNSEFYILLPYGLTELQGATKIEKITMKYKYTIAEGAGWALDGNFKALTWEASLKSATDCTYDCDVCYNDNLSFAKKNSHTYICIEPGTEGGYCDECKGICQGHYKRVCNGHHAHDPEGCYSDVPAQGELNCGKEYHRHTSTCEHVHGSTCGYMYTDANNIPHYSCTKEYDCGKEAHTHADWHGTSSPGCYSTKYVKGTSANRCPWGGMHTEYKTCYEQEWHKDYCQHGYKDGNHGTAKADGTSWVYVSATCTGPAKCSHGHESCYNLEWKVVEEITKDTQELYAVKNAQVIEKTGSCSISNIPLVAKVEINKYITDVNHSASYSEYDSTLEKTNARASLSEEEKEANPVYVEYGDFVTYTIALKNHSNFGVKVKMTDIIPDGDRIKSVYFGSTKKDSIEQLTNTTITISAGKTVFVKVTVQVLKREGTYENLAKIITRNNGTVDYIRTVDDNGPVVNHSSVTITGTTSEPKVESKDYYILNDYNASIDKYISGYTSSIEEANNSNKFTNETTEMGNRSGMSDADKQANPVQVEKGDRITYTIKVTNDAVDEETEKISSGIKKATAVCPNRVTEQLPIGLQYKTISAKVFRKNGAEESLTRKRLTELTWGPGEFSCTAGVNNRFELHTNTILEPGEYIEYYVTVEVTENNMYLGTLENSAIINKLKNINNGHVKDVNPECGCGNPDRNKSAQVTSKEYVKMKDLVISGNVWVDKDKDGLMNDSAPKENVIVKLYSVGTGPRGSDTLVRTTKTDANGLYTFAKDENGSWYNGTYSYGNTVITSEQRIPKATGSTYYQYYIEYTYDGLMYKSTEIYAGDSNLGENGELDAEGKYKIDSNAAEFEDARKEFDERYEIIAYNKAYTGGGSEQFDLSYEKVGHDSWLNHSDERAAMTARSFIDKAAGTTKYLWLYNQTDDYTVPDTEYLKYINLGLEERGAFDISITQDVYEVKTTVNGDEMTYEYNQNDYTLGNSVLDKEQSTEGEGYDSELYMTGYENDESSLLPYVFKIYNSDYNYKASQYNIDTVRDYKGTESELNVEVTYRIKVTNNATEDTVYAGINEIAEYYDSDFVDFELDSDRNVKTFNIKTKDENGYLVNTPVKVVNAEYVMKDGTRKEALLSTTSMYDDGRDVDSYEVLYIRPKLEPGKLPLAGDIILEKDESVDVLITFVVDKEESDIILGDKTNVAEISAYSTYYKREDGTYYSAGLIDHDSNPGNFGEFGDVLEYYEDDTFKTGIETILQHVSNERSLTGFVWDDARSITATDDSGVQYIGDGKYDTSITAIEDAKKNEKVSNNEETDLAIKDMKVQLVEMVSIPGVDSSGNPIEKVYEEVITVNDEYSKLEVRTDEEGKYKLTGYIPGNYVVKFYYGDDATLENMLVFNGQDYKSTTYQATEAKYAENIENSDEVLATLEKQNISDAKDDEIKRLESISYSETITNNINTILRGKDSSDKTALVENTKMESETAQFYVKTEKELSSKNALTYFEAMTKFSSTRPERHQIKNIDFSIEYRPELQVSLDKYIANVKVTTSDSNAATTATPLVDAKFKEYYGIVTKTDAESGKTEFLTDSDGKVIKVDKNSTNTEVEEKVSAAGADISKCQKTSDGLYVVTIAGTELDKENSIGLSNLQYLGNTGDTQGFAYLNIDDEIMQGANISIQYLMVANNLSEIDRVSSNLSSLRFKENTASKAYSVANTYYDQVSYQLGEDTGYVDLDYSGAQTARNKLFSEYYEYELNSDKTIKKDDNGNDIIYRIKTKDILVDDDKKINYEGYYGRYLGSLYYTGVIGVKDIVAELKIDKILDYIDNDLVFNESENNGLNGRWKTTTSQELYNSNLVSKLSFIGGTATGDEALVGAADNKQLVDNKNRAFDTSERSNLAILVDDRIKDYTSGEEDTTINKNISRYLTPRYANSANSYGAVNLVASKVISAEEVSEDMTYDNIAEIVQYSSVTGRVTSLATTLGNATFFETDADGTVSEDYDTVSEWEVASQESDTSATEKVTLTPPTGLGRAQQIVRNTVEGASYTLLIIIAVAVVCVGVLAGIRLYRKRPIK